MTFTKKKELITQITELLEQLIEVENVKDTPHPDSAVDKPPVMLTVKECAALVEGSSENTVRQLVAQDKVAHVRAGAGRNGKILVSKISLLTYLGIAS